MAKIYAGLWEGGTQKQLNPGYHYKESCRTLIVPPGEVVTFYQNQDMTGAKSLLFYEGVYHDLTYYAIQQKPGLIHVERTDLTHLDFIEVGRGHYGSGGYYVFHLIPVGDRSAPADFPNDWMDKIYLPYGVTAEVFKDGLDSAHKLFFEGGTEGKRTEVNFAKEFPDFNRQISAIRITADDWEPAGLSLENVTIIPGQDKVAATVEEANNSDIVQDYEKVLSTTVEESNETSFNVDLNITTSIGFEAGIETAKVTGGVSISVGVGYGKTTTKTTTREMSDSLIMHVEPHTTGKGSLFVEYGGMTADAIQKWRCKRTGAIIEQKGKFRSKTGNKAHAEVHT